MWIFVLMHILLMLNSLQIWSFQWIMFLPVCLIPGTSLVAPSETAGIVLMLLISTDEVDLLLISVSRATWPSFNAVFSHQTWDLHLKQIHSGSYQFAFCYQIPGNEYSHGNSLPSSHAWIFVRLMGKGNPSFVSADNLFTFYFAFPSQFYIDPL